MSTWDGWSLIGSQLAGGKLGVVANLDGRLELFAEILGAQGPQLGHRWQTTPNDSWSPWTTLGAPAPRFLGSSAVARNADGRLEAFARVGLM